MITKFWILCSTCLQETRSQLVWHEQKAITIICYTCGTHETTKLDTEGPPLDTEQYDENAVDVLRKEFKKTDKPN